MYIAPNESFKFAVAIVAAFAVFFGQASAATLLADNPGELDGVKSKIISAELSYQSTPATAATTTARATTARSRARMVPLRAVSTNPFSSLTTMSSRESQSATRTAAASSSAFPTECLGAVDSSSSGGA